MHKCLSDYEAENFADLRNNNVSKNGMLHVFQNATIAFSTRFLPKIWVLLTPQKDAKNTMSETCEQQGSFKNEWGHK